MFHVEFRVAGNNLFWGRLVFTIKSAGLKDDHPYAEVEPHNDFVIDVIKKHLSNSRRQTFSVASIQKELDSRSV